MPVPALAATPDPKVVPLFDGPRGAAPPVSRDGMTFSEVARQLRLDGYAPRTIVDRLRSLVREKNMPPPDTYRWVGGSPVGGAAAVCRKSIWNRHRFMSWHRDRFGDPDATSTARSTSHLRLASNADALA